MQTRSYTLPSIAVLFRWRVSKPAPDTERPLHGAADHADLKRLIDTQARKSALPWWPGHAR
jgi:hypothetical protein